MLKDGDRTIDLDELAREDLEALARAWRRRALRGDRTAYGPAHTCEAAYRRRFGLTSPTGPLREMRPLAILPATKRRWFWSTDRDSRTN